MAAHGAFNQRDCSLWPLHSLKLKTAMDLLFARGSGELGYAQRLDRLYQEVLPGHPPVFELA